MGPEGPGNKSLLSPIGAINLAIEPKMESHDYRLRHAGAIKVVRLVAGVTILAVSVSAQSN